MGKIVIITGGNKGLGLGLSQEYCEKGYRVITISRNIVDEFCNYEQYKCDLSKTDAIEFTFKELFSNIDKDTTKKLTLINNAGDLGIVKPLENISPSEISYTIQVNLVAPLILSSLFIKLSKDWTAKKKIINVSSGAAVSPYSSWATYCSSKAGLDMMTKVISEEQKDIENGVKVFSIYPGIVDTGMQSKIRNTSEENFKSVQKFKDLYERGELLSPKEVAEKIYDLDVSDKLKTGSIVDIRLI